MSKTAHVFEVHPDLQKHSPLRGWQLKQK